MMELSGLKDRIIAEFSGAQEELEKILDIVAQDKSVFPFNEYELLMSYIREYGELTFDKYLDLRADYMSANPNLWIFEISAPRKFGENFAQTYVEGKCSKIRRPSKKLDENYSGDYDLWLDGIRIEVKASRVCDSDMDEPLYVKALSYGTSKNFLMNFQQLKPQCCDVFVWVVVYRDKITTWVMSSKEVLNHSLYSTGQHRGNKGNEGQIHVNQDNLNLFDPYLLIGDDLEKAIREANNRNNINNSL